MSQLHPDFSGENIPSGKTFTIKLKAFEVDSHHDDLVNHYILEHLCHR
jgi:pyrimidine operon attenuation protein/uracil phosphoribosyltransferase